MNDKKIAIAGLTVFIVLFTLPFWWNMGKDTKAPKPIISDRARAAQFCVESKDVMAKTHMKLLDEWRILAVREGKRTFVNSKGQEYNVSLSTGENSCLGCHNNKAEFCDKCHAYANVTPYCWDCHLDQKESAK